MSGKLVIVPTPIGNLADMPPRALDALREADTICAEDTRVTGKLLAALGIERTRAGRRAGEGEGSDVGSGAGSDVGAVADGPIRLERLDENLVGARAAQIIARVQAGERIAYCSDAGMPGVSDPGLRLVAAARAAEPPIQVEVLPGPTAVATAYVASGTTAGAFYFGGFFPRKDKARRDLLEQLRALDAALIFYESPNRIASALEVVAEAYPQRKVAVCRELTKLHEEVVRGGAGEVADTFTMRENVKGEIVIVIDPPAECEAAPDTASAEERARALAASGERPKSIARILATEFHLSRNEAYNLALASASE